MRGGVAQRTTTDLVEGPFLPSFLDPKRTITEFIIIKPDNHIFALQRDESSF
jgi:hypothetical protein